MKKPYLWLALCFSISCLAFAPSSYAQADSKAERKLVTRVEPDYPPVLRMRQIGGTVRLEITINPTGNVESTKVLGGNAILAESGQEMEIRACGDLDHRHCLARIQPVPLTG